MAWGVEGTDEFAEWFGSLDADDQDAVDRSVGLLEASGPTLGRPHVDTVRDSRHANMKELRVQSGGDPLRIFFAFDPRRVGLLLIGGSKKGDDRFYARMIREADDLYDAHLEHLETEHHGLED
jgi:hypothetical protein